MFPIFVSFALVFSSGLFVVTSTKDREDKLRYLLNFSGISSAAYYIGLFFADMMLFIVTTICIIVLSYILKIETITNIPGQIIAIFIGFGISYVPLSYLTGFIFKTADNAFKYNNLVMILYWVLLTVPYIWLVPGSSIYNIAYWLSPSSVFMKNI
jgi:hypothetical protein